MHIRRVQVSKIILGILAAGWVCHTDTAKAGWTGLINGAGVGWGSVNLRHTNTTTGVTTTSKVTTPNNIVPSDSIKQFSGWTYFTNSPTGASLSSYVQQKARSGGVWTNWTSVAANDGSDNPELENRVHITGAPCALLGLDSSIDLLKFATNNGTGV